MSSDESDDYGPRRRGTGTGRGRGRGRGRKHNALAELGRSHFGGAGGGPSKVKLKVKAGGAAAQGKKSARGGFVIAASGKDASVPPQWQGYADRELDSDTEEPLVFEEAFMLRMPIPTNKDQENELQRFADMVKKREAMDEKDVWFKFMDSRRAVFNLGSTLYNAKLVDLPCIIESQKTNDGKHMFKTADISQMLLVEHPIANEAAAVSSDRPFNIEDYIYPHGITPPLRHVRKRRFKPRLNKQAIEIVERQVERLITQDQEADDVKYEMVDESEILEGESGLGQQQYEADLAGIDMSLDPALAGLGGMGDIFAPSHQTNGIMDMIEGQTPAYDLSGIAQGDTPGPTTIGESPKRKSGGLDGFASDDGDGTGEGDETDDDDDDDPEDDDEDEEEGYDSDLAAMIEGEIGGDSTSGVGTAIALTGDSAGVHAQHALNAAGISTSNAIAVSKEQAGDLSEASGGSDEDEDSDDLFGKGRSDDDEDDVPLGDSSVKDTEETLEAKRRVRLMADEMRDLENAVGRKKQEVSRAPNPIIRRRFEDSLKKLSSELELKKAQYAAAQSKLIHAQQEIKRAQIEEEGEKALVEEEEEEEEATGNMMEESALPTAGSASSHTFDSAGLQGTKTDPITVFGSSSAGNPGSAKKPPSPSGRDDAMDIGTIYPPPLGPLNSGEGRVGEMVQCNAHVAGSTTASGSANAFDDVQVRDYAPEAMDDNDDDEDDAEDSG